MCRITPLLSAPRIARMPGTEWVQIDTKGDVGEGSCHFMKDIGKCRGGKLSEPLLNSTELTGCGKLGEQLDFYERRNFSLSNEDDLAVLSSCTALQDVQPGENVFIKAVSALPFHSYRHIANDLLCRRLPSRSPFASQRTSSSIRTWGTSALDGSSRRTARARQFASGTLAATSSSSQPN